MTGRLVLLVLAVAVLQAAAAAGQAGGTTHSLAVGGRTRTFLLHRPPQGQGPLPLVVVLHGGGGNAGGAARMTGMSAAADAAGFAVVYPNGTGPLRDRVLTWNSGNCCGYALDQHVDDVAFLRGLIHRLAADHVADPRRIYITGISNGGMMAYRLACEAADAVTAIAPVAGALSVDSCTPTRPVAVMIFHGTADRHVLYDGGTPKVQADRHARVDRSVASAVAFWTSHDRCPTSPRREEKGSVVREAYTGCAEGMEVVLYTVTGGGHAWPGGLRGSVFGDVPTREIAATPLMLQFFSRHSRP